MGKLNWYLRLTSLVGLGFLILSYQNCGNPERFAQQSNDLAQAATGGSGGAGQPSSPAQTCSTVLKQTTENLDVIFMVDNSGSTKTTDPGDHYRVQVLQNFISQYGSQTNLKYSFGWFGASAYVWDTKSNSFYGNAQSGLGSISPVGFGADLSKALAAFSTLGTQNGTDYNDAFDAIENIVNLQGLVNGAFHYVFVFMSDGQPTDLGNSAASQLSGIESLVSNLMMNVQAKGTDMIMSSVYFGQESDSQSINNLSTMASITGGQFVDTNKVANLVLSDIITVPGQVCTSN